MKIFVVDDELHIRKIIGDYLRADDYEVVECVDGLDCLEKIREHPDLDLILLDVRMPRLSGFDAMPEIKKISDVPVLFLTALDETFDEIQGLELGADDYITKPFRYDILMARVRSTLRRRVALKPHPFELDNLKINYEKREVQIAEKTLDLTKMEYNLLVYLVENSNLVLDRNRILDSVWGFNYYGDPRTVDTHVKTLRSKLGSHAKCILTKRGVGYQFKVE